jgi:SAM-dependent methyltransferase
MLHIAAEGSFEPRLRAALGNGYLTADYLSPNAMVKMDITEIQYPDHTFDVIHCSHVLEHVSDDRKEMREFRRVLKPDGWALIMVPIFGESSFEDSSIVDPRDRRRVYGQEDHVRIYGPDFVDRLREAQFQVNVIAPTDLYSPQEIQSMGLAAAGNIYLCRPA